MDEQPIVIQTPNHPIDVLELFDTSKEKIKLFSDLVIDEVKEGRIDPLKVKALCKSMEAVTEIIDKNTREEQAKEAAKFGDKPFNNYGCEMHLTATKTDYDYESCTDVVYDRLVKLKKNLEEQIKQRQEFLKNIRGSQTLVDDATGEVYNATAPFKKQTIGVKVSIK
jgi:hypothetical protein